MKFNLKNLQIFFRLIVGLVFIYASYDKILDPISFSKNIHNFHITPIFIENLAALIIPWLELIIGILLIFGLFLEGTTTITIALLMFFIFILSQAVFRGIDVHCGCFKSEAEVATTDLRFQLIKRIIEDIILLIFTYFIRFFNKGKNV